MFKENIPGICIEDGLKYCGTPEAYEKFIPQMDCDAVEMVIGELKEYELPGKDEELLKKLEDLLGRFDWEAMEELIKGVEI